MKLDLPLMAAALIIAAALQELLPAPFPGGCKLQLLPGVALYYILSRQWQLALFAAFWAGILTDALGLLPHGTTSLPLFAAAAAGLVLRDASAKRSAAGVFLKAALLLAFLIAAQRLRLATAGMLPLSAASLASDAIAAIPLSAAFAAYAFPLLSRLELAAENVERRKEADAR